ncbi:MAG: hypothetical protein GY696_15940 [Gammaproteobacteria bacterium]|nr:hypothetical protein [Gammaproteobacteria bacterium]
MGIQQTFIYQEQHIALDRYIIVEPSETWQIYNWFQYFKPQMIEEELRKSGFVVTSMVGDLTGTPLISDGDLIGVIASSM